MVINGTSDSYDYVVKDNWNYASSQKIFTKSDLNSAGISGSTQITSIWLYWNGYGTWTYEDFQVFLGNDPNPAIQIILIGLIGVH